jgi:hypothetical protein
MPDLIQHPESLTMSSMTLDADVRQHDGRIASATGDYDPTVPSTSSTSAVRSTFRFVGVQAHLDVTGLFYHRHPGLDPGSRVMGDPLVALDAGSSPA